MGATWLIIGQPGHDANQTTETSHDEAVLLEGSGSKGQLDPAVRDNTTQHRCTNCPEQG